MSKVPLWIGTGVIVYIRRKVTQAPPSWCRTFHFCNLAASDVGAVECWANGWGNLEIKLISAWDNLKTSWVFFFYRKTTEGWLVAPACMDKENTMNTLDQNSCRIECFLLQEQRKKLMPMLSPVFVFKCISIVSYLYSPPPPNHCKRLWRDMFNPSLI